MEKKDTRLFRERGVLLLKLYFESVFLVGLVVGRILYSRDRIVKCFVLGELIGYCRSMYAWVFIKVV